MIYLKIGSIIGDLLNLDFGTLYLEELGKYVCSKYDYSPYKVYDLCKKDITPIIQFIVEKIHKDNSFISKELMKSRKNVEILYRFFALDEGETVHSELLYDFKPNCFANVTNVKFCGEGVGRELMKEFLEDLKGYPVIAKLSVPDNVMNKDKNLEKLIHVFSSIGFEWYPHESIPNVMVHWNGYKKPDLEKCDVFN